MDILLVQPHVPEARRYAEFSILAHHSPPLGLAWLAAAARSAHPPIDIAIVDASAHGWGPSRVAEEVVSRKPRMVGLTATTPAVRLAAAIAEAAKLAHPATKVVLGGPHASSAPEETLARFPAFDWVLVGEGEGALPRLFRALDGSEPVSAIPGVVSRTGEGRIVRGPVPEPIRDLDSLPPPAWDLLPRPDRFYQPTVNAFLRMPTTSLVTSRGCPGRCLFCTKSVHGSAYRFHGTGYVIDLIDRLERGFGIRDVYFHDDSFLTHRQRAVELCEALARREARISWACFARTEEVPVDSLALMRRAGCWQISLGVESGSVRILHTLGKKGDTMRTVEVVRAARRHGIGVNGFFVLGSPGEDPSSLRETLALALAAPFSTIQASYYTPFPGTAGHATATRDGTFDESWDSMTTWTPVFVPVTTTRADLEAFRRLMFRRFYLRPRTAIQLISRVRSLGTIGLLAKAAFVFALRVLLPSRSGRESKGKR